MGSKRCNFRQIANGICLIEEDDACIYILTGTDRTAVIDTGYGSFDLRETVRSLSDKPIVVLCTHGHPDHIYGARWFDEIYLNEKEIPVMNKYGVGYKREEKQYMMERFGLDNEQADQWLNARTPRIIPLNPGMKFDLGGYTLEAVDLCGHTQGSIGFICKEARILFSGDGVIERSWLHLPESASIRQYYSTIRNLSCRAHEFDQIYTGHKNAHKPASFLKELTCLLEHILEHKTGIPISTGKDAGLLAGENGCQIIFDPARITE